MTTPDDVLTVARSQLGETEHPPGSNDTKYGEWYGWNGVAWCDIFMSWCFDQAGALDLIFGKSAYVPGRADTFKAKKQWGTQPRVGALVFMDTNGNGGVDHIGICEALQADGRIVNIEGNTSDQVLRRVRRRSIVIGYGYPAYTPAPSPTPSAAPPWPGRYLRYTSGKPLMRGDDVLAWQRQMKTRAWTLDADGLYGPRSAGVCRAFQETAHLTVDSVVGPATWKAAWEANPA